MKNNVKPAIQRKLNSQVILYGWEMAVSGHSAKIENGQG